MVVRVTWMDLLTGLGIAAVLEGLALALAPSRFTDIVRALEEIPRDTRRGLGLTIVVAGIVLVWIAQT